VARELESIAQAAMLVRASLVSHGDLVGVLASGAAVYSHNDGNTKTIIVRPRGERPEGVSPLGHSQWLRQPELVEMGHERRVRSRSRKGGWSSDD
jgi:hypothetical protein